MLRSVKSTRTPRRSSTNRSRPRARPSRPRRAHSSRAGVPTRQAPPSDPKPTAEGHMGKVRSAGLALVMSLAGALFGCQRASCQGAASLPRSVADLTQEDPARVDPQHYKAELENEHVRIVRAHYGPGEQAAM